GPGRGSVREGGEESTPSGGTASPSRNSPTGRPRLAPLALFSKRPWSANDQGLCLSGSRPRLKRSPRRRGERGDFLHPPIGRPRPIREKSNPPRSPRLRADPLVRIAACGSVRPADAGLAFLLGAVERGVGAGEEPLERVASLG